MTEPQVSRPQTEPGYGIPKSMNGALDWSWARGRLEGALVYWVASVRPDGRPHVTPIWGAWVDDAFWMEGGPKTRRFRNLSANRATVVSIERGDDAVIVEGHADRVFDLDPATTARLVVGYAKYIGSHGYAADPQSWDDGGIWRVRPTKVLAWSAYPKDATRWTFGEG